MANKILVPDEEFEQALEENRHKEVMKALDKLLADPLGQILHIKQIETLLGKNTSALETFALQLRKVAERKDPELQIDPQIIQALIALNNEYKTLTKEVKQLKAAAEKRTTKWNFHIQRNSMGLIENVTATPQI